MICVILQINSLTEKLSEAKDDFEKCMEINPTFVPAKVQLAFCIYKTAMTQQSVLLVQGAKRMFTDIITNHPKHADAYSLFAQVNIGHRDQVHIGMFSYKMLCCYTQYFDSNSIKM